MSSKRSLRDDLINASRPASTARSARTRTPKLAKREAAASSYSAIKGRLLDELLDEIGSRFTDATDEQISQIVDDFVVRSLQADDLPLNGRERERLADSLREEALGLGPLAPLMNDPAVTDILVNRYDQVYVERFGRLERANVSFRDDEHVSRVIERIASRVGRRVDAGAPMLDARLSDGSRVNATLPPISIDGPTLSIRRFGQRRLRCQELLQLKMFSAPMLEFLDQVVKARQNVLVSGGTGAGKSTLLGAVAEAIPDDERIITIEDTAELILDQDHVVRMETRPPNVEGQGEILPRDLVINSLRMRPDRIIVGECRGAEALDMLQAMNTGHDGGMTTVHANSPRDSLARIETMVLMAGLDLPSRAVREQIASAIQYIVHVRRYQDGVRRVESICEIAGMEGNTILLNDIFVFRQTGAIDGRVRGRFEPTGIIPSLLELRKAQGVPISHELFRATPETFDDQ